MKNVTIVDVARESGLSLGTVSRAIRGAPHVRPDKVEIVRKTMLRLGYTPPPQDKRPGPRGPRRASLKHGTVAAIFSGWGLKWIMNSAPVYANVLHGIESALAQQGMPLMLRHTPEWGDFLAAAPQDLKGIVLFSREPKGRVPDKLRQIPMVYVMGTPKEFTGDHISPDHQKLGELAARFLLKRGHKHCAYLGTGLHWNSDFTLARGAVFQTTIEQAGGKVELLIDAAMDIFDSEVASVNNEVVAQQIERFVALSPRPTAMLVQADMYLPVVYRELMKHGIQPQQDLAIVSCNNERPFLNGLQPTPTVLDLQSEAIGRRAIDQLIWRMQHPHEPPMRIMIEPILVESVSPAPRTA